MLSELYDMDQGSSNRVLITAGGQQVELPLDEKISKSLATLWIELKIENIES